MSASARQETRGPESNHQPGKDQKEQWQASEQHSLTQYEILAGRPGERLSVRAKRARHEGWQESGVHHDLQAGQRQQDQKYPTQGSLIHGSRIPGGGKRDR